MGKLVLCKGSSKHNISSANGLIDQLVLSDSLGSTVSGNLNINQQILFSNGILEGSSADTILLGPSGKLSGETNASYLKGVVKVTNQIGKDSSSFGGIGVFLDKGPDDLGTITVTRKTFDGCALNPRNNQGGVNRVWEIDVSGSQPIQGRTVSFDWLNTDDLSVDISNAFLYRKKDANAAWEKLNTVPYNASLGPNKRRITATTNHFSTYTVSDGQNPLPVVLLSLVATWKGDFPNLHWVVTNETNVLGYVIERQKSSLFDSVGFVTASNLRLYEYQDRSQQEPLTYRLRIVDRDGKFTYSPLVSLNRQTANQLVFYPNPFNQSLSWNQEVEKAVLYALDGKKVAESHSTSKFILPKQLQPGLYLLELTGFDGVVYREKVVKE
jgi:hypothetical protein